MQEVSTSESARGEAAPSALKMLSAAAFARAPIADAPYRHFVAEGVLTPEAAQAIRADFPETRSPGFLAAADLDRKGAYAALLDDLESDELAAILSEKLDIDLEGRGRLITVRRWSRKGDGRIHTDSERKIATVLIYLNQSWNVSEGGAIRVLRSEHDFEDYAREVPPVEGNAFGFRRAPDSWHGHKPFEGERLVVQLTYLQDAEAAAHKRRSAGFQGLMKKLFERTG
jgi:SM-20-related protein